MSNPLTPKERIQASLFMIVMFILTFALFAWAAGCATVHYGCVNPEDRAAKHGLVLECMKDPTDNRFEVCHISTKEGPMDVRFRSCE